jgi:hypothetical protein
VSDFPPPPQPPTPPSQPQQPLPPPASPPISTPPPLQTSVAKPTGGNWFGRKRFGAPLGVWLLVVVAIGAVTGVVLATRSKDDNKASSGVTTETEADVTTAPPEPTGPTVTNSVASSEPAFTLPIAVVTEPTTPPPTTTPTSSSEVAGSPAGVVGDRANPVPPGAIADIGGGWRLQVLNVNPDAAAVIAAENQFNDPPPPGSTFSLVTVALGYFGKEDPKSPFETTISAVASASVELPAGCGVVPQQLDSFGEIFAGGVVVGNVCFVTTPQDAGSLELYATGDLFSTDKVFLDARTAPVAPTQMSPLTGPQAEAASTPHRTAPTPIGTPADVGGGWKMTISAPASDITDSVLAENQFNDPPPDGFRFVGVGVTYAFDGAGSASGYELNTQAVGATNVALARNCGVFSSEIDLNSDIFSGGSVSGSICFVVPAADPALVLYATASFDAPNVMFATS